jgi:hypothetical protein
MESNDFLQNESVHQTLFLTGKIGGKAEYLQNYPDFSKKVILGLPTLKRPLKPIFKF